MKPHTSRIGLAVSSLAVVVVAASAACTDGASDASIERSATRASASVVCSDPGAPIAPGAWVCGTDRTLECQGPGGTYPGWLLVTPIALGDSGPPSDCSVVTLAPSQPLTSPLPVGDYTITVREDFGTSSGTVCSSTLHIVDTAPPVATPVDVVVWPPDHAMHDVAIADCVKVTDTCDGTAKVSFTYVSSDEAPLAHGSGHTSPDVEVVDCGHLRIRGERAGGAAGRVYVIGYEAVDHSNNRTSGTCRVLVPHDQSGRAVVGGAEAYRLPVDTTGCL